MEYSINDRITSLLTGHTCVIIGTRTQPHEIKDDSGATVIKLSVPDGYDYLVYSLDEQQLTGSSTYHALREEDVKK